jgi:hypothetical protein
LTAGWVSLEIAWIIRINDLEVGQWSEFGTQEEIGIFLFHPVSEAVSAEQEICLKNEQPGIFHAQQRFGK